MRLIGFFVHLVVEPAIRTDFSCDIHLGIVLPCLPCGSPWTDASTIQPTPTATPTASVKSLRVIKCLPSMLKPTILLAVIIDRHRHRVNECLPRPCVAG